MSLDPFPVTSPTPLVRPVHQDEAKNLFRLYRRTVLVAYAHTFPAESPNR